MADTQDSLDRLLAARMAALGDKPLSNSVADAVLQKIDIQKIDAQESVQDQIQFKHSARREWVLFTAAALSAVVMFSMLAGADLAQPETTSTLMSDVRDTLTVGWQSFSNSDLATPYLWLLLLLPAGLWVVIEA